MTGHGGDVAAEATGSPGHRNPRSGRASALAIARVLGALLSATLLLGFGYGWYEYRSLDSGLHRLKISSLGQQPDDATAGAAPYNGTDQNILVVGIDSRDGLSPAEQHLLGVGHDTSTSTDTIMIIHVPGDGTKATMISIPRDSFVDIPKGWAKNKINAAYADAYGDTTGSNDQKVSAGADLLIKTVSNFTGLKIDHYVQVGFDGFYRIAKALNGIAVNLCATTDDTHAHNIALGQGSVGSDFKMSAGRHHLTPVQVLQFVRQRHNLHGGDVAREKRQRYFLTAAFNKISSAGTLLNIGKLNATIKAIRDAFYLDDQLSLLDLAKQMANLSANNITGYTIPNDGPGWETVVGKRTSVLEVDPTKVQTFVQQALAGTLPHKKHGVEHAHPAAKKDCVN